MINDLILRIVNEFQVNSHFKGYKFRKRDCKFVKKTDNGFNAIELQFWDGFDLNRNCRALVIKPLYLIRFDILHKWFEKFSFKTLTDQRDNYSIGFDGKMINNNLEFYFRLDNIDFEVDFAQMEKELILNSQTVFENFSTLSKLYNFEITPILENNKDLPNVGADWVFKYLKLCSIIKPDNYEKLKLIILKQVEELNKRNEPNIVEYYFNLKDILLEIEPTDNYDLTRSPR